MRHPPCSAHVPSPAPSRLFGGVAVPAVAAEGAPPACTVECSDPSRSDTGRRSSVAEDRNSDTPLGVWELYFGLAGDQEVTWGWDARCSESGVTVTAAAESGDGGRGSGSSVRT
ncbi:cellulose binding domain-containing protein [Streptomyces sp. NBC_01334]|uniref:cellulose binding domain-containing protein n=1 Tax=Streptomyces sp. NBC_01334 TaxID=2903827 RepID=UPI002E164658|nr:cellulose binding domain-containing protein [Streptomyces sp. NBC_01334]